MGVIRTHTERLEKVIDAGIELRHNMRVKTETKSQIIAKQRETILNQSEMIKEMEKELKELRILATEKAHLRQMALDDKKQDKLLHLAHAKKSFAKAQQKIKVMKSWIKNQNGGVMPDEFKWDNE
jgi:hypothetical protein